VTIIHSVRSPVHPRPRVCDHRVPSAVVKDGMGCMSKSRGSGTIPPAAN
jgi:hypothetical protein